MIKIDIFSGFLGAGKTTLIKKLIKEVYRGEQVVLIENEFGEIGVDGGFLRDSGIQITEMNSGCICCTLVGDFARALKEVAEKYAPTRIIIEPSGVGKLSDVIRAVQRAEVPDAVLNAFCTVVDAARCKKYIKNFGEFFLDQVENASCVVLSHTSDPTKVDEAVALLKEHTDATIVTTDWNALKGEEILAAIEKKDSLAAELEKLHAETEEEHCHCHHHDGEEHIHCRHADEEEHCHHGEEAHAHGCHGDHDHHDHGHHHHADDVFSSWGVETNRQFTKEKLSDVLGKLSSGEYGQILRAKGIVDGGGAWFEFDYVPGETDVRTASACVTGRLCVIGCKIDEQKLSALFLE